MNRFRMIFGAILVVGGLLAIFAGPNRQNYHGWETIVFLGACALVIMAGLATYPASWKSIVNYLGLSKQPKVNRQQDAKQVPFRSLPDGRR